MRKSTGEGNGKPLQCSCLENPRDEGAGWAAVYGVAESDTTEVTLAAAAAAVGKDSACNAGDLSLIPGSRKSAGEGIGYPLQYFGASLVAQLIRNPPAMRETWI